MWVTYMSLYTLSTTVLYSIVTAAPPLLDWSHLQKRALSTQQLHVSVRNISLSGHSQCAEMNDVWTVLG